MKYFNVAIRNQNHDLEAYVVRAETSGKALLRAKAEWDRTHSVYEPVNYQWTYADGPDDVSLDTECKTIKRLVTPVPVTKPEPSLQNVDGHSGMFFHLDGKEIELSLEPVTGADQ